MQNDTSKHELKNFRRRRRCGEKTSGHWEKRLEWPLCLATSFFLLLALAGCDGKSSANKKTNETEEDPPTVETDVEAFCKTQRQQFHQGLWAPLFIKACQGCHNSSGAAILDERARFVLLPETYPNAAQANLNTIASFAKEQAEGSSYLLAKVSGKIPHLGNTIYPEGSEEYRQLESFISELNNPPNTPDAELPPSCENVAPRMDSRLSAVQLLDAQATFRKATINIAGRLPTSEEEARLEQTPEHLRTSMEALLEEEAFYERLKEVFNDMFLFSLRGQRGFAFNYFQSKDYTRTDFDTIYAATYYEDFPNIQRKLTSVLNRRMNEAGDTTNFSLVNAATATAVSLALWEEPLALIAYIARNNLPFTEILTANYTVVNPYSAYAYNLGEQPAEGTPANNWWPVQLIQRQGTPTEALVPSSGILSTAAFLAQWTTTATNLHRGRAEFLSKNFLATSILSFAQRPVNSTQLDATNNPTVNNPACAVCHYYMDGLSPTFTGFGLGTQATYQPHLATWDNKIYLPTFQGEIFPRSHNNRLSMPWMAERIAADPRFPYAMVLRVFEGITGRKPLEYPSDITQPNYVQLLAAWESQNAFLHEVASKMAQQGMNIKVAFREILLSPYFRAAQDAQLPAELAIGLGEGRLLTPEILSRKIKATLGTAWGGFSNFLPNHSLTSATYNVLYGGIHPTENAARLTQINTIITAVAGAMAREMGCRLPAWEFAKLPAERILLTHVQVDTKPLRQNSPGGPLEVDSTGEQAIRENLAYLHKRLFGENLSPHSPEVDLSYALFVDAWKERAEANEGRGTSTIAHGSCAGRWDLSQASSTGSSYTELPSGQQLTTDAHYTLYAWETVLTYLLMDFRFIHE